MSRVGIVTIIDQANYGNRLQNFALQEALLALGIDTVQTIRNTPHAEARRLLIKRAAFALVRSPIATVRRQVERAASRHRVASSVPSPHDPDLRCRSFTSNRIHEYPRDFSEIADLRSFAAEFDAFVVGSDQVWNPGFRMANEIDFLSFAEPHQRIAYGASFGVPAVPAYLRSLYRKRLVAIPAISTREQSGAAIVADLTKRIVPVVVDPTLLLGNERWVALGARPHELRDKDYVLTFFLGALDDVEEAKLREACQAEGLSLIDFRATPFLQNAGPEEFLGAIEGARLVVTDSFHAAAMSLILETPFRVVLRHSYDTRMSVLQELVGHSTAVGDRPLAGAGPDWSAVAERLGERREDSLRWLADALDRSLSGP